MNYVSAKEARAFFCINPTTLMTWKNEGKIRYKKFSNKKYLYDIDSFEEKTNNIKRLNVIYARVSNAKQKAELDKQIDIISNYMLSNGIKPDKIYKEIASGMNENRKELNLLIDDIIKEKIDTVYISFKDRLTRFGFDYLKNIFAKYNTKIEILNENDSTNTDFNVELANDIISIIHHFSMKLYSNQSSQLKEIEKIIKADK